MSYLSCCLLLLFPCGVGIFIISVIWVIGFRWVTFIIRVIWIVGVRQVRRFIGSCVISRIFRKNMTRARPLSFKSVASFFDAPAQSWLKKEKGVNKFYLFTNVITYNVWEIQPSFIQSKWNMYLKSWWKQGILKSLFHCFLNFTFNFHSHQQKKNKLILFPILVLMHTVSSQNFRSLSFSGIFKS